MLGITEAYVGPLAGLATSVLWTFTSLLFTSAGRRIGVTPVNTIRIFAAVVFLALTHAALSPEHRFFPALAPWQCLLLALSGLVGLTIGDQALFTAFMDIGPRLALLAMTTAPLMAAFFGWLSLGEVVTPAAWLGIACTLIGVAWVLLEKPGGDSVPVVARHYAAPSRRLRGVTLALLAAACQAVGLLLSKRGMGHGVLPQDERLDPQAAALVRMAFAALGMLPLIALHAWRARQAAVNGLTPPRYGSRSAGFMLCMGGALVGPYLGMWCSLIASDRAPLAVAQTLFALPPVLILPFTRWLYRDRATPRAVLGALLAVGGVALLFVTRA